MATVEQTKDGYIVNGFKLTEQQYTDWKSNGSPEGDDGIRYFGGVPASSSASTKKATIGGIKYDLREDGMWYIDGTNKFGTNQEHLDKLISNFGGSAGTSGEERLPTASDTPGGGSETNIGGEPGQGTFEKFNPANLQKTEEFKALSPDDQEAVLAVFNAVANNDQKKANQLISAFEAAAKINDPFFAQQFRIAADTVKRGFVEAENDLQYKEQLQASRLSDLQQDIATRSEFLTLEEQNALKGIERQYKQDIDNTRQNMAARGMTFSSRRANTEGLINEATGDIRESTQRRFGIQQLEGQRTLERGTRDIQAETERIRQLAEEGKLDLFRQAEANLGTLNLPGTTGLTPLGDITGALPQEKLQNTITAAQSFVF